MSKKKKIYFCFSGLPGAIIWCSEPSVHLNFYEVLWKLLHAKSTGIHQHTNTNKKEKKSAFPATFTNVSMSLVPFGLHNNK